jgi:outer membrane biosynthesis protein TonB
MAAPAPVAREVAQRRGPPWLLLVGAAVPVFIAVGLAGAGVMWWLAQPGPAPEIATAPVPPAESPAPPAPEPPKPEAVTPPPPPVVEPEPPPPPVPAEAPKPKPKPKPSTPSGRFIVEGDAEVVALVAGDKRYPPGKVPAGKYTIEATFPGRGAVSAGTVTVPADGEVTVSCSRAFARCTTR